MSEDEEEQEDIFMAYPNDCENKTDGEVELGSSVAHLTNCHSHRLLAV